MAVILLDLKLNTTGSGRMILNNYVFSGGNVIMKNGRINARSSEGLVIQKDYAGLAKGYRFDPVRLDSPSKDFAFRLAYFFSEYIWGHLILTFNLCSTILWNRSEIRYFGAEIRLSLKRTVDILGAILGLILTSPLFIILPILIKLDSPGPVFYHQLRVGINRRRASRRCVEGSTLGRRPRDRRQNNMRGCPIKVIKFRTMVADAEKKCGPVWATQNDPRITRLGRFLRKSRLDEIPQFINVLMGEMALVGPRPERPAFVADLCSRVENYDQRLQVRPGITGLAQVENGYDSSVTSVVRKVHYDLKYIQTWSLWADIKILLKTVVVVVTGKGAF